MHSEALWIELFLTARGLTFVRPYDQEQVYFPAVAVFPHNPESSVRMPLYCFYLMLWQQITVGWTSSVFYLQADKDYLQGEISINYWELLGSLSSFMDESLLGTSGIDMEEYQLQKQATLNSLQILLHFGQLPLNNINNTHMILQIKLSFDDVIVSEILKEWTQQIQFITNGVAEIRLQPGVFPHAFMSVARLVSLRVEDMRPNIQEIIAGDRMVNFDNEFRAMQKVYQLLQQYIDSYSYSEEYIEEIWQVHHANFERETILTLRLHYCELQTLRSAQEAIVHHWNDILEKGTLLDLTQTSIEGNNKVCNKTADLELVVQDIDTKWFTTLQYIIEHLF